MQIIHIAKQVTQFYETFKTSSCFFQKFFKKISCKYEGDTADRNRDETGFPGVIPDIRRRFFCPVDIAIAGPPRISL